MSGLCNISSEYEVTHDMDKGTTYLSQTHYAEEISTNLQFLECHSSPYTHASQHAPQQRRL